MEFQYYESWINTYKFQDDLYKAIPRQNKNIVLVWYESQ